jgi:hypothetical protein
MPVDLLFGKTSQLKDVSTPEYVHNLTNRMDKVHDIAKDRLLKAADRQKLCCDRFNLFMCIALDLVCSSSCILYKRSDMLMVIV